MINRQRLWIRDTYRARKKCAVYIVLRERTFICRPYENISRIRRCVIRLAAPDDINIRFPVRFKLNLYQGRKQCRQSICICHMLGKSSVLGSAQESLYLSFCRPLKALRCNDYRVSSRDYLPAVAGELLCKFVIFISDQSDCCRVNSIPIESFGLTIPHNSSAPIFAVHRALRQSGSHGRSYRIQGIKIFFLSLTY